jgi:hypothetical protein
VPKNQSPLTSAAETAREVTGTGSARAVRQLRINENYRKSMFDAVGGCIASSTVQRNEHKRGQ